MAIEQAGDRDKYVRSAFNRWLERDASAAQNWLLGAPLTESLRGELAKPAAQRGAIR